MTELFVREDWKLFRNLNTLTQKAGVSEYNIPKLVVKELVDNALDVSNDVEIGGQGNYFWVWNGGQGIEEDRLCELFSINRPMVSSKVLRLPSRGALGNGLRVVVGAVIATGGKLFVSTKGKKYEIISQDDGSSKIEVVSKYDDIGTKIEIVLGNSNYINTEWVKDAVKFNKGSSYKGKTSAYWYNSEAFFDLLQAFNGSLYDLVSEFDGCTSSSKLTKITKGFPKNTMAKELSFSESEILLTNIRQQSKQVNPTRLGSIGEIDEYTGYNMQSSIFTMSTARGIHNADIPIKVEILIEETDRAKCKILINKSPVIKDIYLLDNKKDNYRIWGNGLDINFKVKSPEIIININTPYMPITSDGKEPDFRLIKDIVSETVEKAIKKYKKKNKLLNNTIGIKPPTQKEIILTNLQSAVRKASGEGKYRFSVRQLFYVIRPILMDMLKINPDYKYFKDVIMNFQAENEDIPGMYNDPRGSLYTPHINETMPVGTLSVEKYKRPKFTFNKVIYIEKEGFFEVLKDIKFPERYDCALLTSKGYASTAVKDLLDYLGDTEEEIQVFCIHDCDKAGTMIYQTLQEETKIRGKRKVNIIDLGLNPSEAISMNLEPEKIDDTSNPAADYLEPEYKKWLQTNRVELNAMTTPQFIEWIESKMNKYGIVGKVIPEDKILDEELTNNVKYLVKERAKERILMENNFEQQCNNEVISLEEKIKEKRAQLKEEVGHALESNPVQIWKEPIKAIAEQII